MSVGMAVPSYSDAWRDRRRQGAWERPAPEPISAELKPLVVCVGVFAVLFFLHPYLFGVSAG